MSKLKVENGQAIAKENIEVLYHFPDRYKVIKEYLQRYDSSLKRTLLAFFNYAAKVAVIPDRNRYQIIIDTKRLTTLVRRKKDSKQAEGTTNRHMNLLCALGLLKKVYQTKNADDMFYNLKINSEFIEQNKDKNPINVYSFHAYTDKNLQDVEEMAITLKNAGVTSGNISQNYLAHNGLDWLAQEIYFNNDHSAPEKKAREAAELFQIMAELCDWYGYASRDMVKDNLNLDESEIDKLFKIFKLQLKEIYKFAPPTKEQMQIFHLKNRKYIYTRRKLK